MKDVSIIGVDLAKQVFQLHGATSKCGAVFRKKLSRKQFLAFMQTHSPQRAFAADQNNRRWHRDLFDRDRCGCCISLPDKPRRKMQSALPDLIKNQNWAGDCGLTCGALNCHPVSGKPSEFHAPPL